VCNPQFLDREGAISEPQDMAGKTLLHDTDRQGWQNWMRAAGLKHAGPAPGPTFEDFNLLRAAALAGQGVALCPKSLVRDDLASGRLIQLFNDIEIKRDHAYYMIEPADAHHQHAAAIARFKEWLLEQAKSD
jgi:DNA-binding transcriptional LysR family regulator